MRRHGCKDNPSSALPVPVAGGSTDKTTTFSLLNQPRPRPLRSRAPELGEHPGVELARVVLFSDELFAGFRDARRELALA